MKKGDERDVLLHLHNPLRNLLLIQNTPLDLPTLALTLLVSKLALPDAHPRRRIAEAHLGIIKDTLREPHAVLHKVDNESLAVEVAVLVRVHLHIGVTVVVVHEHATFRKAGSNLLGCGMRWVENTAVFLDTCGSMPVALLRFFGESGVEGVLDV